MSAQVYNIEDCRRINNVWGQEAKWPVWARLVIITGLSALLWAGAFSAGALIAGGMGL